MTGSSRPSWLLAIFQVPTQERLGVGSVVGLVEERGEQVGRTERIAVTRAMVLGIEPGRGAQVGLGPVVLAE